MTDSGQPKGTLGQRVTTAVRLPKDLYKQLKHEAIDREVSVNSLIEQATQKFMQEAASA